MNTGTYSLDDDDDEDDDDDMSGQHFLGGNK